MQEKKESKFQVFAEVLPNNPRTAKILKDREEEAAKKAEKEAAVSFATPKLGRSKFGSGDAGSAHQARAGCIIWSIFQQLTLIILYFAFS